MTLFTEFYAPVPPTVEAQDRNATAVRRDRLGWLFTASLWVCVLLLGLESVEAEYETPVSIGGVSAA